MFLFYYCHERKGNRHMHCIEYIPHHLLFFIDSYNIKCKIGVANENYCPKNHPSELFFWGCSWMSNKWKAIKMSAPFRHNTRYILLFLFGIALQNPQERDNVLVRPPYTFPLAVASSLLLSHIWHFPFFQFCLSF